MFLTEYCAATDVGLQRNNNEDCHIALPLRGLWVVADGMGGHAAGEVASAIACSTIRKRFLLGASLNDAIQDAHKAVLDAADMGVGSAGMGSTVVAMVSSNNHFQIAWVGDSRAYSFCPGDDPKLQQLTRDHSYVQMLLDTGAITREEFAHHPEKNIITQCLGSIDLTEVDVGVYQGQWHSRRWVLLCSDGLSDAVSDDEISQILHKAGDVSIATSNLVKAALNNGGRDNITVQIVGAPSLWARRLQSLSTLVFKALR